MAEFIIPSTPKRRKEHREKLEAILNEFGFQQDRWGNWIRPRMPNRRIKFKSINVRIEKKSLGTWLSTGHSYVVSQMSPEAWTTLIKKQIAVHQEVV